MKKLWVLTIASLMVPNIAGATLCQEPAAHVGGGSQFARIGTSCAIQVFVPQGAPFPGAIYGAQILFRAAAGGQVRTTSVDVRDISATHQYQGYDQSCQFAVEETDITYRVVTFQPEAAWPEGIIYIEDETGNRLGTLDVSAQLSCPAPAAYNSDTFCAGQEPHECVGVDYVDEGPPANNPPETTDTPPETTDDPSESGESQQTGCAVSSRAPSLGVLLVLALVWRRRYRSFSRER